jgi:peptide/nickel transport system permease protein
MFNFILRRLLWMVPTILITSMIAFLIIQLPPGDFATQYMDTLSQQGTQVSEEMRVKFSEAYGFDQPPLVQYYKWIEGIVTRGDFGVVFGTREPVSAVLWYRFGLTVLISLASVLVTWLVAIPVGIFSAVRQYSVGDYVATFLGFLGVSVPGFLIALVVMYIAFTNYGVTLGGLFSDQYLDAPWSWDKFVDLIQHTWLPVLILGLSGMAELIRIMRANLLDELRKPYVVTARAKGLPELKLLLKYPVRHALNPFVSTLGWILPALVSGSIIISVVMGLPTTGPILLTSLMSQDMYLAGSIILVLSILTIIGTLISDILLAWLDPRIRYQ